jgi:hypothetical protein
VRWRGDLRGLSGEAKLESGDSGLSNLEIFLYWVINKPNLNETPSRKYLSLEFLGHLVNQNELPVNPIELPECLCSIVMGRMAAQDREASLDSVNTVPEAQLVLDVVWELPKEGVNLCHVLVR